MAELFHILIYQPIYNALAFTVSLVPGADVGIGIVVITVVVRLILFPLSLAAIKSQIAMRRIDPELKALREKYKNNREELGRRTLALFRENKINPFAGFLLILVQLPVIIGLYTALQFEAAHVSFDPSVLYSFIEAPDRVSLLFLGLVDLGGRSVLLAALAGVTQFLYARLLPAPPKSAGKQGGARSFQEDFASSMQLQMLYVFPVLLGGIAYFTSAAIALYFVASNTFSVLQELVVQRLHGKGRSGAGASGASR